MPTEKEIASKFISAMEELGLPEGTLLKEVALGEHSGYCDLILVPNNLSKAPVLIEVKQSRSGEAKHAIVGQMLLYLSRAAEIPRDKWQDYIAASAGLPDDQSLDVRLVFKTAGAKNQWDGLSMLYDSNEPPFPADEFSLIVLVDKMTNRLELTVRNIIVFLRSKGFRIGMIAMEPEPCWIESISFD